VWVREGERGEANWKRKKKISLLNEKKNVIKNYLWRELLFSLYKGERER